MGSRAWGGAVKRAPEERHESPASGYGRFAAAVNSLLIAILCALALAHGTNAQTAPIKLAVLGDSLAAGYGVSPARRSRRRLEAALKAQGRNVTVINHGVSGDTTAGGLRARRLDAGRQARHRDGRAGRQRRAARHRSRRRPKSNLDAIIAKLKAAGVTVWLAGMLAPRNFGPEYAKQFDGLYQRLADKYGVPLYPFFLDGVAQDPALNQADGIHPNPKGVDVIVERLLPFVTKNLDDSCRVCSSPCPSLRRSPTT